MRKILKQLVFLSILLESRNKVAMKNNARAKDAAVRNQHLKQQKERQYSISPNTRIRGQRLYDMGDCNVCYS